MTLDAKLRAFAATGRLVADEPVDVASEARALFGRVLRSIASEDLEHLPLRDRERLLRTLAPIVAAQPERAPDVVHERTYADVLSACVVAVGRAN